MKKIFVVIILAVGASLLLWVAEGVVKKYQEEKEKAEREVYKKRAREEEHRSLMLDWDIKCSEENIYSNGSPILIFTNEKMLERINEEKMELARRMDSLKPEGRYVEKAKQDRQEVLKKIQEQKREYHQYD